jgi:hypothetical protein
MSSISSPAHTIRTPFDQGPSAAMATATGAAIRAGYLGLAAAGLAIALVQARGAAAFAVRAAVEALLLAAPLGLATPPGAAGSRAAVVWAMAAPILHAAGEASGGSSGTTGLVTAASAGMIMIWNAVQGA